MTCPGFRAAPPGAGCAALNRLPPPPCCRASTTIMFAPTLALRLPIRAIRMKENAVHTVRDVAQFRVPSETGIHNACYWPLRDASPSCATDTNAGALGWLGAENRCRSLCSDPPRGHERRPFLNDPCQGLMVSVPTSVECKFMRKVRCRAWQRHEGLQTSGAIRGISFRGQNTRVPRR